MKLFAPPLGTRLRLTEPLTFALRYESRNTDLADIVGELTSMQEEHAKTREDYLDGKITVQEYTDHEVKRDVALPAGTVLSIERIYIRKGVGAFDSMTFRGLKGKSDFFAKKGCRFWMKLTDANKIECEVLA